MFDIKSKVFKKTGRFYDLNVAYSSQNVTPPSNWVIRCQPVFIAIFGIKSKVLIRPLRI